MAKFLGGDLAGFVSMVSKTAQGQVSRRANQTMRVNAKRDGHRCARVPMGGETCTFCAMLASRGFVYRSAKLAGEGDHFHPNCRCKVIPEFGSMSVQGYDPGEWMLKWKGMQAIDDDKSLSSDIKEVAKARVASGRPAKGIDIHANVYSNLTEANTKTVARIVDAADGDGKALYLSYEYKFTDAVTDSKEAYFSPRLGVFLDQATTFHGKKETGDTWFHEFGTAATGLLVVVRISRGTGMAERSKSRSGKRCGPTSPAEEKT